MRWLAGDRNDRRRWAGVKLTVEVVPETCWFSNLRSELSSADWDRIRRQAYKAAGYRCEVCGGQGRQHRVECHERWIYDDQKHVQRLDGVIALCPSCHEVKHIGYANVTGHGDRARAHLAKVNGWNRATADQYLNYVSEQWRGRSRHQWSLDLHRLRDYGIEATVGPLAPGHRSAPPAPAASAENSGLSVRALTANSLDELLEQFD